MEQLAFPDLFIASGTRLDEIAAALGLHRVDSTTFDGQTYRRTYEDDEALRDRILLRVPYQFAGAESLILPESEPEPEPEYEWDLF